MGIVYPNTIPINEIKQNNSDYDCDKIAKYEALYRGGDLFRDMIEEFLIKRKSESTNQFAVSGSNGHYEQRKKRAPYANRAGGIIDWMTAAVFREEVEFVLSDNASQQSRDYWEGLNQNADGLGTPLSALARQILSGVLTNFRSYFKVEFRNNEGRQDVPGSLDASIVIANACEVDDWQFDETGALSWLRIINSELERDQNKPWLQSDIKRVTWSFYDSNNIAIYEAKKRGNIFQSDSANLIDLIEHDFGLPIFDVRAQPGQWVMERIYDVVVALFNRDAAVCKYLDDGAFQMLRLILNRTGDNATSIVLQDLNALLLEPTESADWIAPQPGYYSPLQQDQEQLKKALYEVIQSTALNAAAMPQAGRLSGEAVKEFRDPLQVLLNSFAFPVRDALERVKNAILTHRNEQLDLVEIKGMGEFKETMEDAKTLIMGKDKNEEKETASNSGEMSGETTSRNIATGAGLRDGKAV